MHELRRVETAEDWGAFHRIRRDVLFAPGRHGIAYDENHPDDRTEDNVPFLLVVGGEPLGVVRLDRRGTVGIVRLVAIRADRQRQGHGRVLDALVVGEARRVGIRELRVNAAPDAEGYYRAAGWRRDPWGPAERIGISANTVQMSKPI